MSGTTNLPPATLDVSLSGDTNHVFIESAHLASAVLIAELDRHLELHFTGPLLREPAQLRITVDLSHQQWVAATGKLEGEVDFTPFTGKFPRADFRLKGDDIGSYSLMAERLNAEGSFQWPGLSLQQLTVTFDDESRATLRGGLISRRTR